ncbi:hypothetical protein ABPG74_021869 [Tetrahymena malaccensis]
MFRKQIFMLVYIVYNGVTDLYIFTENLTGEQYSRIIEEFLVLEADEIFEYEDWLLCQDPDPKQASKVVNQMYERKIGS